MRFWRRTPEDDRELEQETGIKPADHTFVTPAYIRRREREILGPRWFQPRPKEKK
jgi:hypothetical protein